MEVQDEDIGVEEEFVLSGLYLDDKVVWINRTTQIDSIKHTVKDSFSYILRFFMFSKNLKVYHRLYNSIFFFKI